MTEREQFEAWMRDTHGPGVNLVRSDDGYISTVPHRAVRMTYASVQMLWEGWQAARAQPAQAVPLLSDDEIDAIQRQTNAAYYAGTLKDRDHSRAIEAAVRAKLGVAVPMTDAQIDAMATACKYTFHATMIDHRALARAVEHHHGIVGEKGGA